MTNLLLESFDHFGNLENERYTQSGWVASSLFHSGPPQTVAGRFGGQATRTATANQSFSKGLDARGTTEIWFGVSVYRSDFNNLSGGEILRFGGEQALINGGNIAVNIWPDGALGLSLRGGFTTEVVTKTDSYRLSSNVWHFIEGRVLLSNTVGEVEFRVNGNTVLNETNLDTLYSTFDEFAWVELQGMPEVTFYDDLYVNDGAGSAPFNGFLGEVYLETLRPNADGYLNNFTAVGAGTTNADRVDDAPADTWSANYVHASTVGDIDAYQLTNLSSSYDTIKAVRVVSSLVKNLAGEKSYRNFVRSSATNGTAADRGVPVSYVIDADFFETDPNTASAWTAAAINAMEIGIEIRK